MSKKLGKFLLFTAAAGSAAAAAYYFVQKKDARKASKEDDHFTAEDDEAFETSSHYVPLTPDSSNAADEKEPAQEQSGQPDADSAKTSQDQEKTPSDADTSEKTTDPDSQADAFHFTPLSKQVFQAEEKAEETIENFF